MIHESELERVGRLFEEYLILWDLTRELSLEELRKSEEYRRFLQVDHAIGQTTVTGSQLIEMEFFPFSMIEDVRYSRAYEELKLEYEKIKRERDEFRSELNEMEILAMDYEGDNLIEEDKE